jgi:hypothetical protein
MKDKRLLTAAHSCVWAKIDRWCADTNGEPDIFVRDIAHR